MISREYFNSPPQNPPLHLVSSSIPPFKCNSAFVPFILFPQLKALTSSMTYYTLSMQLRFPGGTNILDTKFPGTNLKSCRTNANIEKSCRTNDSIKIRTNTYIWCWTSAASSFRQDVLSARCLFGKMSFREDVFRQDVFSGRCLSARCLFGKMSFRQDVFSARCLSARCLFGKMSFGKMSFREDVFRQDVFSGRCLSARCLFGKMSFGKMSFG